jgi:hypothetical protein
MSSGIKAQAQVARIAALALAAALGGCASVRPVEVVDPASALEGHDLQTAVNLYGPYDGRLQLAGRTAYVWRRSLMSGARPQACELRAEVGYHDLIRATVIDGSEGACRAFWIRYTSNSQGKPATKDAPAGVASAAREANWRPVGAPAAVGTAAQGR